MKAVVFFAAIFAVAVQGQGIFGTNVEKAFQEAKKKNLPVLIDFYGVWCPPCNQMNETVFETTAFLKKAKHFVLVKLDADDKSSWKWKDQYKVGGYPTYLFTDWRGRELYRIVGARSSRGFFQILDLVRHLKNRDISQACQSEDTEELWRCAVTCAEREDSSCAEKAYKKLENKLKPGSARYQLARTYFVEHAPNEDLKRDGYQRLLEEHPSSPLALQWALEYLKGFEPGRPIKPKGVLLEKVLSSYEKMRQNPSLDDYGLLSTDLAEMRADLFGRLGKTEQAQEAWREAARLLEKLASQLPPKTVARGFAIDRISCLDAAGDRERALSLANEYRTEFPEEFTFHFWAASILEREKKYAEALPVAQKAFQYSYGDNKIRSGILMIDLFAALSNQEGARKTYQEIIDEIKPDKALHVRTHRYLKQLEEAFKKSQVRL